MQKKVARLEKIVIEMCTNSEKSSNVSEKSKSSLRWIRSDHRGNKKRNHYQERENENKRSASARTNDSEQKYERNNKHDNDKFHKHAWEIEAVMS